MKRFCHTLLVEILSILSAEGLACGALWHQQGNSTSSYNSSALSSGLVSNLPLIKETELSPFVNGKHGNGVAVRARSSCHDLDPDSMTLLLPGRFSAPSSQAHACMRTAFQEEAADAWLC